MIFRQLVDEPSNTYTFLVACPQTSEAILIDPVYEQVRAVGLALLPAAQELCCWDKKGRSHGQPGARTTRVTATSMAPAPRGLRPDALRLGAKSASLRSARHQLQVNPHSA